MLFSVLTSHLLWKLLKQKKDFSKKLLLLILNYKLENYFELN